MNNDIRKLIDDNWEDIKELIAQKAEAEQKPKTIWDLNIKDREVYYCIDGSGIVCQRFFDSTYDEQSREISNAFLTREEAEFEKGRRKIEAIIRKYSRPFRDKEENWHLLYNYDKITNTGVVCGVRHEINAGIPYFETKKIAQKVIDEIGKERLEKYWFKVIE